MIKLYEIQSNFSKTSGHHTYTYDESEIKSDDVVTEGFFLTPTELSTRERKAFEAGRYGLQDDDFEDYLKSEEYLK